MHVGQALSLVFQIKKIILHICITICCGLKFKFSWTKFNLATLHLEYILWSRVKVLWTKSQVRFGICHTSGHPCEGGFLMPQGSGTSRWLQPWVRLNAGYTKHPGEPFVTNWNLRILFNIWISYWVQETKWCGSPLYVLWLPLMNEETALDL